MVYYYIDKNGKILKVENGKKFLKKVTFCERIEGARRVQPQKKNEPDNFFCRSSKTALNKRLKIIQLY